MGRQISLFTDYHQDENRITNYCGLLLKMLHAESPRSFSEVMQSLTGCDLMVEPYFEQQRKSKGSIPDLSITQGSFAIFFETKLTNWFHDDQIERHLQGLGHADTNILFLLCNFENDDYEDAFKEHITIAAANNIILAPVSYEDLLSAIETAPKSERLASLVEEFRIFLDQKGLFPRWKYLLDVVNCYITKDEIDQGYYACPNTGGSYAHQRAKYFGPYGNKKVSAIHEIDAVVVLEQEMAGMDIKWNNSAHDSETILDRAQEIVDGWPDWRREENKEVPIQIFLLSSGSNTSFLKTTPGGLFGSKKYFHDIARDVLTAQELAEKLNGKCWEDYRC